MVNFPFFLALQQRSKQGENLRALIADPARGTAASGARHIALHAGGFASSARGRAHAEQTLCQEAFFLVDQHLMGALELADGQVLRLAVLAGTLFAKGVVGSKHRPLWRQFSAE